MNILLAHGSSDSRHVAEAQALADRAAKELGTAIELRFLSSEEMPDGAHVLPLLLGEGWHARNDITRLAAASDCTMLSSLSDRAASIAGMAADLAADASTGKVNAIFAVYHFRGFETVVAALHELKNWFPRMSLAAMYSSPDVREVLAEWDNKGVKNMVVQPLTLFEGRTMEKLRRMVAESGVDAQVGPTLSAHADFPAFIAGCFRESR